MDEPPPFQNMNQMFNVILQLEANVANLTAQNQNLQTQIKAMEAAAPAAAPPPWAPPGLAPGAIHGAGIPPPVINLDAGTIGAVIAQAMPAPPPQTARGPMANELEPFDGKMENVKSFIRSCQIYSDSNNCPNELPN